MKHTRVVAKKDARSAEKHIKEVGHPFVPSKNATGKLTVKHCAQHTENANVKPEMFKLIFQ